MTALHDAVSRAALAVCEAAQEITNAGWLIPDTPWTAIDHLNTQVEREARGIEGGGTAMRPSEIDLPCICGCSMIARVTVARDGEVQESDVIASCNNCGTTKPVPDAQRRIDDAAADRHLAGY